MKPTAWIKWLRGAECKADGRCYDILFCDPNDNSYEALYSHTAPLSTDASACPDSGFLRSSLNKTNSPLTPDASAADKIETGPVTENEWAKVAPPSAGDGEPVAVKDLAEQWADYFSDAPDSHAAVAINVPKQRRQIVAALRHAATVPPQKVACWRYRNQFDEVVSEWIDGAPPEHVQDVQTCEVIATKDMKIDVAYTHPAPAEGLREASSSIEYQQKRGVAWDIVDEALIAYNDYMLDDDFNAQRALDKIMLRMDTRRAFYNDGKSVLSALSHPSTGERS